MATLVLAWLTTLLLSSAADLFAHPRVAPWHQRTVGAITLHMAASTGLWVLFYLLLGRAWFATLMAVGTVGLVVVVSNAKFKALREPIVFSDLALFAQSLKHPRLYFPFLSWVQLAVVVLGLGILGLAFSLDTRTQHLPPSLLMLAWLLLLYLQRMLAHGMVVSLNPVYDQAQHGFFAVFVIYLLNGLRRGELHHVKATMAASPYGVMAAPSQVLSPSAPDVIVIQSESFFDIRALHSGIYPQVLTNFDHLRSTALCTGQLNVPAWGANTMRTEHAFLSGVPNTDLRYAQFYPYAFVTQPHPSLPHAFNTQGYQCNAVHPYYADFFGRDKVFPRLGFEHLADVTQFTSAENRAKYSGPYIADEAVTDWLIHTLEQATDQPRLLFAITMENHGPLHLEKATLSEAQALYTLPDGQTLDDLTVYLRHTANADKMLGRLQQYLATCKRDTVLCFYGDHVPGMGHVFEALGANPHASDYLIWRNRPSPGNTADRPQAPPEMQTLTPESLGLKLAQIAGLTTAT